MRMERCESCDARIDIASDHERWCPKLVAMRSPWNPDGSKPNPCDICGVDHRWNMADLSHGIIRLLLHAQERAPWHEFPANGDMIARQRNGMVSNALLFTIHGPDEFDWDVL